MSIPSFLTWRPMRRWVWVALLSGCLDAFPDPPAGEPVELDRRDQGGLPRGPAEAGVDRREVDAVSPPRDASPIGDAVLFPDSESDSARPVRDMAPPIPVVDARVPDPPDAAPPPRHVRPGDLLINEVDYNQPGNDDAEFIELVVTAGHRVDLDGVRVELFSAGEGNSVACGGRDSPLGGPVRYRCAVLPSRTAEPGEHIVLATEDTRLDPPRDVDVMEVLGSPQESGNLQNGGDDGGDGVLLVDADGRVLDGLAYEAVIEGVGEGEAAAEDTDSRADEGQPQRPERSLSRCPDSNDSNNNKIDFDLVAPTPGRPNGCP